MLTIRYRQARKVTQVILADGAIEGVSRARPSDRFNPRLGIAIAMLTAKESKRLEPQQVAAVKRYLSKASWRTLEVPESMYGILIRRMQDLTRAVVSKLVKSVATNEDIKPDIGVLVEAVGKAFLEDWDREERLHAMANDMLTEVNWGLIRTAGERLAATPVPAMYDTLTKERVVDAT